MYGIIISGLSVSDGTDEKKKDNKIFCLHWIMGLKRIIYTYFFTLQNPFSYKSTGQIFFGNFSSNLIS